MEYNILKETSTTETVKKIKKILKKLNINIQENILKYEDRDNIISSLHIYMKNNETCSSNGKGTSLDNAKASAYAEFMERLQSQFLFKFSNSKYIYSPDEKIVDINYLDINPVNKFIENKKTIQLINKLVNKRPNIKNWGVVNKTIMVPFYGYKEEKTINLPIYIISYIQGSTGIAAGNTIEEAMVQGLSEICERYVQTRIITENISMPNIEEAEYLKYKKIRTMIKLFNRCGCSVQIKDASLGMDLPVVCAIIHDHITDNVSIKFGASPSFPIAVERCLTEYMQGYDLTAKNKHIAYESYISKCSLHYTIEENNLIFLDEKIQRHNVFIENCEYIQNQFYNRKPDFLASKTAWIKTDGNVSNKELLNFLLKKIKKHTDSIYVRNISFLGFPSVIICIPEMTFFIDKIEKSLKYKLAFVTYREHRMPKTNSAVQFIYNALLAQGPPIYYRDFRVCTLLPNEYILLLCAILLEDFESVKKYSNCIILNKKSYEIYKKTFLQNIIILNDFSKSKLKNIEDNIILKELITKYSKEDIEKFLNFKNTLCFDVIKNIIMDELDKNETLEIMKLREKIIDIQNTNIQDQEQFSEIFAPI